jgi:Domain of unknown function (DUF4252)
MKTMLVAIALAALASMPVAAQNLNLDLGNVAAKATSKNEITLDKNALQMVQQAAGLAGKDKDGKSKGADLETILSGVQAVAVRNYEFAKAGDYADSDLDALRAQVKAGSGWTRIVYSKEKDESSEIYLYSQDGKPGGMLIISAEAKELSVVHISGMVQLAQLKDVINSTIHYDMARSAEKQ